MEPATLTLICLYIGMTLLAVFIYLLGLAVINRSHARRMEVAMNAPTTPDTILSCVSYIEEDV